MLNVFTLVLQLVKAELILITLYTLSAGYGGRHIS